MAANKQRSTASKRWIDQPLILFFVMAYAIAWGAYGLVALGSGGSLITVLLFHAAQNWEEGFETIFPSLVGTNWELISTLALLLIGIAAGVLVWRKKSGKVEIAAHVQIP